MLLLPIYDLATRSASGFIIRKILPRSIPPQLIGPSDRRPLVNLPAGDLILGAGHGSPSEFYGHNNELLWDSLHLPNAKGKVVVLVSCETAQELGPALISHGATAFVGYYEDVLWVADAEAWATPWKDKFAEPVMGPIVQSIACLFDGKTVQQAYDLQRSLLQQNLAQETDEFIASLIAWNLDSVRLLGDGSSRIRQTVPANPLFSFIPPPPIILPVGS